MCMTIVEHKNFIRLWRKGSHIADVYDKKSAQMFRFSEDIIEEARIRCEEKLIEGT